MALPKLRAHSHVIGENLAEAPLEQEERRIRQGMRLRQKDVRKENGLRRTFLLTSGAILLGSVLGWAGSRFWDA
jgi:hypothetical protein